MLRPAEIFRLLFGIPKPPTPTAVVASSEHITGTGIATRPSVCDGCKHYHGLTYGGVALVCGMHPYGQEDCRDWEK